MIQDYESAKVRQINFWQSGEEGMPLCGRGFTFLFSEQGPGNTALFDAQGQACGTRVEVRIG